MAEKKNNSYYDIAVIGSGLTGLAVSVDFSKRGYKVALFDSAETWGGLNHQVHSGSSNGLRWLAGNELGQKSLEFLSQLLDMDLSIKSHETNPWIYDSAQIKSFMGFGDAAPEFHRQYSYFLSTSLFSTTLPVADWAASLFQKFTGDFFSRSEITQILVEQKEVQSIQVNGQKIIQAKTYVFCAPLFELPPLMKNYEWGIKHKQRATKGPYLTALQLDLIHPKFHFDGYRMGLIPTQNDLPSLGFFQNPSPEGHQTSHWMTFVPYEQADDSEKLGEALKKIKRNIKKVFPEVLENKISERVLVAPFYTLLEDFFLKDCKLPDLKNFYLGCSQLQDGLSIYSCLIQAKAVSETLLRDLQKRDTSFEDVSGTSARPVADPITN